MDILPCHFHRQNLLFEVVEASYLEINLQQNVSDVY